MEKLQEQKFLFYSLMFTGFAILLLSSIGKDYGNLFSNLMHMPIAGAVVVLSLVMVLKERLTGVQGKAWLLFFVASIVFLIGDILWFSYELEYVTNPSNIDYFWLAGSPLFVGFMILYLLPVKRAISKKNIFLASILSVALVIPSLYATYDMGLEQGNFHEIVRLTYPILDAVVLVPAVIGVVMFFTGKVNFMWTLICFAVLLDIVADTGFLLYSLEGNYDTVQALEILYLWSYILLAFGVYDHIRVFTIRTKPNLFQKLSKEWNKKFKSFTEST